MACMQYATSADWVLGAHEQPRHIKVVISVVTKINFTN